MNLGGADNVLSLIRCKGYNKNIIIGRIKTGKDSYVILRNREGMIGRVLKKKQPNPHRTEYRCPLHLNW